MLATDTIYGLVGSAMRPATVERIYKLKERHPKKPFIVLISSLGDLNLFQVKLKESEKEILSKLWPAKVSVILPVLAPDFEYLHRGTKTVAFRLPQKEQLINLLGETGPLVAPSANPESLPPARTIHEAENYFGEKVDFYLDEGRIEGQPSALATIEDGKLKYYRIR